MRKHILAITAGMMAFSLTACSSGNTLLEGASPENSALALYQYENGTVTSYWLYDTETEEQLLAELAKVPVRESDWTLTTLEKPVYGLEIGTEDGFIGAAWSDGHWIASDGTVYDFDFDFAALKDRYAWEEEASYSPGGIPVGFPAARAMMLTETGWNRAVMAPAAALTPAEGLSMELVSRTETEISVIFDNQSSGTAGLGNYFSLQVQLDGVWYEIPPEGDLMFTDIAYEFPAGSTFEKTYDISPYGELPAGTYRLVSDMNGLAVEFTAE